MSRLSLALLLAILQDGAYLPLKERNLQSPARDDRQAFAFFYSRDDAARHRKELLEMARSGVDVALVLGDPERLGGLVQALEDLEREGKERPRLAPAIDPASFKDADLTADDGIKRLYAKIRASYARVPPRFWGLAAGRPLVWLLPAPPASKHDRSTLESLNRLAKEDFDGRSFFVVADVSWRDLYPDRTFAWGAAHAGPRELPVVSVGPGCADPERLRDDGKFYERSWYIALRLEPRWVAIETWNGAAEGTDVAESRDHKRKYVEITQRCLRDFRLGEKTPLPKGKWTGASKALYTAKYNPHEQGLRPVETSEGAMEFVQLRGVAMLTSKENRTGTRRALCFDVDDSFSFFERRTFDLEVEFMDTGEGAFSLEYDSWDKSLEPGPRAVKSAGERRFTATSDWRTERFDLPDARFGNLQPGGSDFRLVSEKRGIAVRRVALIPK